MIPGLGQGRIHLLGICGTGMASLAGMLKEKGFTVSGSDQNTYPPMSEMLCELGIDVRSPYGAKNVPSQTDLVVVGNAISRGNPELEEVLDRRLPYVSMPEVIKELFIRGRRSVVVTGTHGKTTTTSLIVWILESSGASPGFLVGGIPRNFGTSYRLGSGDSFVIEGDEYDTAYFDKEPKFLHYLPEVVVLGNVEYDHADIYPDVEAIKTAFRRLVNLIPRRGLLVVGSEDHQAVEVSRRAPCHVEGFALTDPATWQARLIRAHQGGSCFEVRREGKLFAEVEGPFWGDGALRNALAALAVGHAMGVPADALGRALTSFKGVRRRLEELGTRGGVTVVDDFAHHPTAVRESLQAARLRWPGRRLWAVFEPRSFTTRSKVFQHELPDALATADRVVVASVFSSHRLAREEELSEEELVGDLRARHLEARFIPRVDDIVSHLEGEVLEGDVLLLMSNGDFGGLHRKLLDALKG